MKTDSVDAILASAPLPLWQEVFGLFANFQAVAPWKTLQNYHFIGLETAVETIWVQVLGSGGESPGINLHRGTGGLAALLRILAANDGSDAEAQVLMRGLDCLSLSLEGKKHLDEIDFGLLRAAHHLEAGQKSFPVIRDCKPGWYPWYPNAEQLAAVAMALRALLDGLPQLELELLEPEDDNQVAIMFYDSEQKLHIELRDLPDFDLLDQVPAHLLNVDSATIKNVEKIRRELTASSHQLELGCIVLAEASNSEDGGRPFFPQVIVCVEAKSHALLAHQVLSPDELTLAAWRNCLLEGIEAMGQIPSQIATDDPLAAAAVYSISDLLGSKSAPESRLKALGIVERAIDHLL